MIMELMGITEIPMRNGETIIKRISEASKCHYNSLTSENAKFGHYEYKDKLFPFAKPITAGREFVSDKFYTEPDNFILVGDGGSGKTTALLKAWKELLTDENLEQQKMVPIYIPLNEVNSSNGENFIADYCQQNYSFEPNKIIHLQSDYRLLFLMDGFNEITINAAGIIKEIRKLYTSERFKVVFTSRYDFAPVYRLERTNHYELQLLGKETIQSYLQECGITEATIPYDLLSTPMMLTLYTNTNLIQQRIDEQIRGSLPFCESRTKGELLYNFMLCQTGKTFDISHINNIYIAYLALFVVSPYIAYNIEQEGKFFFPRTQFKEFIRKALKSLNGDDVTYLFDCDLVGVSEFGSFAVNNNERNLPDQIYNFLVSTLAIMQIEEKNISFRHQYFRDYFAASYVILDIRLSLRRKKIPESMIKRIIPNYVAVFIGDCLQEYEIDPKQKNDGRLECLLELARNKNAKNIPLLINNIVNILSLARVNDLSGIDLHQVDLSLVSLNGLCFSQKGRKANFQGTILSANTFLPQGHIEQVRSAIYSSDGRRILSAGDTTIKEWDVLTGQCIMTFSGHENLVNSAVYSPNEKRILSAANDNTIKEWDRVTGQCIATLKDHGGYVTKAIYSADGSGILSSSWDGNVLWYHKMEDGCWSEGRRVAHHDKNVKSIALSKDGLYCLTASGDHTVKEWKLKNDGLEDDNFQKEYIGHENMVNSVMYSPDDRHVLTGSYDGTVRIFDRITCEELFRFNNGTWVRNAIYDKDGKAILIASHEDKAVKELERNTGEAEDWILHTSYLGHSKPVTNISLNFDGSRILSSSEDGSIWEWDRLSSQNIKVYSGNMFSTTDTVYSNDGMLVLTIKGNEFFMAQRNNGQPEKIFGDNSSPITSVDFSPDCKFVLATSKNGLCEWTVEKDDKIFYQLPVGFEAEHARYAEQGTKIICLAKNSCFSTQTEICVFSRENKELTKHHTLSIKAIGIQPLDKEQSFLTFSSNAIIRKWNSETGGFLGVNGVEVKGCDFSDCCFLDRTIKKIIIESDVVRRDLYVSEVTVGERKILLQGDSLVIYSEENEKCFTIIDKLYEGLCQRQEGAVLLNGNRNQFVKERFQVFLESDSYVKRKIDPYEVIFKSTENEKILELEEGWSRFLSHVRIKDYEMNIREKRLIMGILSELLCNDEGEILEDLYYQRGAVFICQIDAGICSSELQSNLVAAFIEVFPNLQFIVSTSSEAVMKGVQKASTIELGVKVFICE